jgi:very-short-patch-repair endonuclease
MFVKNLENVQGDERDVIIISIGYGPRIIGARLDSMHFGPVSAEGGERRLNVLFTRARVRCEVFTSFNSEDIDLARTTKEGARVLKRYLRFAERGTLDLPLPTGAGADSPFEEAVARAIVEIGFGVEAQVGSAGFKIDLAVKHPDQPGRYILAVECDGATYHSARWARERDRLRQEILEDLGWSFHRIWSTDWFYNPKRERQRLAEAIQFAKARN